MRVCQTIVVRPLWSGVHSARAVSPSGTAAKKLVLLSIVVVIVPRGRLTIVAMPPRWSASAMSAPPCRMPWPFSISGRTVISATMRSGVISVIFHPMRPAKAGWFPSIRSIRAAVSVSSAVVSMRFSIDDDTADRLARMHQLEALVDVGERERVGDHRIDLDLALHVPVHDLRHVGAAACAAEGGALPHPAGNELEGAGCDLCAARRNPDDDRYAPAAMAGFERLAHHRDVAGAVECVVGAADLVGSALGHVHEIGHKVFADLLRVDEMRHAEALAPGLLGGIDIDPDDHVGADEPQPLDHIEANSAKAADDCLRARPDPRGRAD